MLKAVRLRRRQPLIFDNSPKHYWSLRLALLTAWSLVMATRTQAHPGPSGLIALRKRNIGIRSALVH